MGVPISNVTRRVVYAASGTGPYNFTFEILAAGDVAVYKDDSLLTLTTDYTVTINANGTGYITLTASPTGATQIAIVGNRTIQRTTDFVTGGDFFANTVNDEMDQQTIFAQQNAEAIDRSLKAPQTDPTNINMTLPRAALRAGKTLAFDASGNPSLGDTLGTNRGNWAAGTLYYVSDIVKDTTTSNIWQCVTQHTSSGSQPISTNADAAKWFLLVDAASAGTSATAAAASASAAATSASDAATSASNAASSASTASTQASNASTSATNAANSATAAASSASTASTQASNAATSATSAATSASQASTSASNAASSASTATTQASNAATSATNAANSATSSASSATDSANSATASANSATAAADSATSAAASAAAAAASYDSFDDRYLGSKTSDPTVDNDGNALLTGALYWNSSLGQMKVYDGAAWQIAYVPSGSYLPLSGGTLTGGLSGTTLTLSGAATLNGGTANGVAYLNGSKVLTTGSALTFDGTNLGVGAASPTVKLQVDTASASGDLVGWFRQSTFPVASIKSGSGYAGFGQSAASSETRIFADGATSFITNYLGGSEAMRLTSTGLGIGTSSPGTKVDAAGNIRVSYASSGANASLISNNTSSTAGSMSQIIATNDASRALRIQYASSGGAGGSALSGGFTGEVGQIFTDNAYPLSIGTSGVAWLNLSTSGNLGLGVTPSAWLASSKVIQVGNGGVIEGRNNAQHIIRVGANSYLDSAGIAKYIGTGNAMLYEQYQGTHAWFTAPSGTAGNAISFTQAATLTANGNYLLGTTSEFAGSDCKIQAVNTTSAQSVAFFWNANNSGNNNFIGFATESAVTQRGSITYNRSGGLVAYNTTSDYRAKDIIGPVIDSGAVIDSTPVYMGKMKGATQERPMFIAHETPPYAHTGEKDAVDADGNPVYQQMDASALVPVLWAEVQSLRKRITELEQLKADVAALKGAA